MKWILITIFITPNLLFSQEGDVRSTNDLSFLIGDWNYSQTYNPGEEDARTLTGNLTCKWSLDSTFIKCNYQMNRPGKRRALLTTYYNYNSITDNYESLWLSSTWPVKVLMKGELSEDGMVLKTNAEFLIEDGITEFVKDELYVKNYGTDSLSFFRKTYIQTSKEKVWRHHMNDEAIKKF